jgi:predicted ABC-type sugar transport system permease subunit
VGAVRAAAQAGPQRVEAIAPVVLGAGERLFGGVGEISLEPREMSGNGLVTHLSYRVIR